MGDRHNNQSIIIIEIRLRTPHYYCISVLFLVVFPTKEACRTQKILALFKQDKVYFLLLRR